MIAVYGFYFGRPWWLMALVLVAPVVLLAVRSMKTLGGVRRVLSIALRVAVVAILAALLADPTLTQTNEQLTLIVVFDRSKSVPPALQDRARAFLVGALTGVKAGDRLAVVDVAEAASILQLPSSWMDVRKRNATLRGTRSNLARGIQMAMAIAPPDTAVRILLITDGNETEGDLKAAAHIAAANGIAIDVLPMRYSYPREVVFKRIAAPPKARSGQTIPLRFVLHSTGAARGKLMLKLNGRIVDLDPLSPAVTAPLELRQGTNVHTISLPVGMRGVHEFDAVFVPDGADQDGIEQNNRAGAMTLVAGPGYVLVVDADGASAKPIIDALQSADIEARYCHVATFPDNLTKLMDIDAVVLADTECVNFSLQQQEMLCRYVTDLGGGLVMTGGPNAFGAGGWIGSPVAKILPLDLDPPQKKQMPKGALVLIMHACEMPRGNYWGQKVALAAVNSMSRRDLVGVVDYAWRGGDGANWVYPLSPAGDKKAVRAAIKKMEMGDMPDYHAPMKAAYQKLKDCDAGQKHMIIISDGDASAPSSALLTQLKEEGITCTGVAVFPHSPADVKTLQRIAGVTGGRFYNVKNPNSLPRIFLKEAQVVRRSLINEKTFTPQVTYSLSEIIQGAPSVLPQLDGLILTGPKGGPTQIVLASPTGDPVLATGQAGLGRCAAFTSTADARWGGKWLEWSGSRRFWEQTVRWASKSSRASDCEVFADVEGRKVTVTVEAADPEGKFVRLSNIAARVICPDMSIVQLPLTQVGPGRYRGQFRAAMAGSHLLTVRYRRPGGDAEDGAEGSIGLVESAISVPYAPEFRDLTDNAALLSEVAAMTGGREIGSIDLRDVGPGQPGEAPSPADEPQAQTQPAPPGVPVDLFDRAGVKFPKKAQSLTTALILIWIALFLLDVAVRRIALDTAAIARRVKSWLPGKRVGLVVGGTLDKLRHRREQLREQLRSRPKDAFASRRFEASEDAEVFELPKAKTAEQPAPKKPEPKAPAKRTPARTEAEQTHLQQLLKARRKAKDRPQGPQDSLEKDDRTPPTGDS